MPQPAVREIGEFREDPDQPAGLRIGQRTQQHRVHHAENRGRGADSQRQAGYRRGGEAGILPQHAKPVSNVLREGAQLPPFFRDEN